MPEREQKREDKVTFFGSKSYFRGYFDGYFWGDSKSRFLVTVELLLILRGFGGFIGCTLRGSYSPKGRVSAF